MYGTVFPYSRTSNHLGMWRRDYHTPSAVLSTHTGGFTGYTFRDLTEDIPALWITGRKKTSALTACTPDTSAVSRRLNMCMI